MISRILPQGRRLANFGVTAIIAANVASCTESQLGTNSTMSGISCTSPEAIEHFRIVSGSEFGEGTGTIRKWTKPVVTIAVKGNPTAADRQSIAQVAGELNSITGGKLNLQITNNFQGDINIAFVPKKQMGEVVPNYEPDNLGFFWASWNGQGSLTRADIGISTTEITQLERNHLIREELTQSMGLMQDTDDPRQLDSIFQRQWTSTDHYNPYDICAIQNLYNSNINPKISINQAIDVLTLGNGGLTSQPAAPYSAPALIPEGNELFAPEPLQKKNNDYNPCKNFDGSIAPNCNPNAR